MKKRVSGFAIGMPTEADVTRLVERFGMPSTGALIAYADVEACLRVTRDASRFWSVTSAWRKKLEREQNLLVSAVPNEGFCVLDSRGRVGHTSKQFKHGLRSVAQAGRRAAATPRAGLTGEENRTLDYVSRTSGTFKAQAALEARKLRELPPAPPA